jgi:hypothetical protein
LVLVVVVAAILVVLIAAATAGAAAGVTARTKHQVAVRIAAVSPKIRIFHGVAVNMYLREQLSSLSFAKDKRTRK